MKYPIVIHKDPDSIYSVMVPDLPGCYSAGDNLDEAKKNSHEAILCHLEGLLKDGLVLPLPKQIESHIDAPEYSNGMWVMIDVDLTELSNGHDSVTIAIPSSVIDLLDNFAKANHISHRSHRDTIVTEAVVSYITRKNLK